MHPRYEVGMYQVLTGLGIVALLLIVYLISAMAIGWHLAKKRAHKEHNDGAN